jgi:muramoyltetrapeptide carboxypeptidase
VTRPRLVAGQHARVVAPAGPVPPEMLERGVARLRGWGLRVSVAPHVTATHPDLPYLAGTDAQRAADLAEAWLDPEVDAVFCARGGYGCLRIVDLLDWAALAAVAPKPFVGSSDVTALHHAVAARLGVPTVFAPMVATTAFTSDDDPASDALRACLFDTTTPVVVTGPEVGPLLPGTGGRATGIVTGGNASLLAGAAGGPDRPLGAGAIVLLEDITEDPYRLDRIITQLRRAGWFDHAAGIALGTWVGCGPPEQVRTVLADRLGDLRVPIAWGLDFGHGHGQASIPLGVPGELDADTGRLTVP